MKRLAICFAAIPGLLGAIEFPIAQTTSGPYEVCISAASPTERDAGYTIVFRERATQKVIGTAETIGCYITPAVAAETSKVLWHPSGQFVAFTDRATKHSGSVVSATLLARRRMILERSAENKVTDDARLTNQ